MRQMAKSRGPIGGHQVEFAALGDWPWRRIWMWKWSLSRPKSPVPTKGGAKHFDAGAKKVVFIVTMGSGITQEMVEAAWLVWRGL